MWFAVSYVEIAIDVTLVAAKGPYANGTSSDAARLLLRKMSFRRILL